MLGCSTLSSTDFKVDADCFISPIAYLAIYVPKKLAGGLEFIPSTIFQFFIQSMYHLVIVLQLE
jgi:hypothetical protein